MSSFTPRRSLRPSLGSSPNLRLNANNYRANALAQPLNRKASLGNLNSHSPDASRGNGISTVDENSHMTSKKMAPLVPSRGADGENLDVGDSVDVPGNMYGIVRFIGSVQGKKGLFAGVELSEEFATRGKNNGDVDGISYFQTEIAGAGIFLPINRATKRASTEGFFPLTPTPSAGGSFKLGGQGSKTYTPPTPSLPRASQSVGPGRAPSPGFKKSRPSLPRPESPLRIPRPESPLRLPQLGGRPSITTPTTSKAPPRYASPGPAKFGQSVRGTKDSGDPSKRIGYTPRTGLKAGVGPRSASALGQTPMSNSPMNISDDDTTPVGVARTTTNASLGSISSFNSKIRPASRSASRSASRMDNEEVDRLRVQVEERDMQLKEQASSLAEMESALAEVQTLMGAAEGSSRHNSRGSLEDSNATQLRAILREKNEKIAMLTAEFDAHRADFRSTIDTLELASTETERVYEKRVDDLLRDIQEYQERTDDVDSVARQLKQLEELVQELEEGLEDARRGEAEARGEVEFLRGEVERTRSELRREREKAAVAAATAVNGPSMNGDSSTSKEVEQRDDEIRGLKAIIHSLSRDAVPDTSNPDSQKTSTQRQDSFKRQASNGDSMQDNLSREKLERELQELRIVVEKKTNREDELERELEQARRSSVSNKGNQRSSGLTIGSSGTATQDYASPRDSKSTVVSWRDREDPRPPEHRRGNTLETMPESDTYSSTAESFCELCETSGHDILTCTNMFSTNANANNHMSAPKRTGKDVVKEGLKLSPQPPHDDYKPAPLSPMKKLHPERNYATPLATIPNPMDSGPVAGKESRVVNMEKWCGVCEREGHDSIDCPFEDAF